MHNAELRRCLIDIDIAALRKLWAHVAPGLPQPESDDDVLISLHIARTQAASIPFKLRAWSHGWLIDNGFPSALPDHLKPRAERMYPRAVEGVGISVNATSKLFAPIVGHVRGAMEDAVMECYGDGTTEPEFVRSRMLEAKKITVRKLLGV